MLLLTNSPPVPKRGRGEQGLRQLVHHPEIALACAASLGLPIDRVGHAFLCVLPGHAEAHPSASLHRDPRIGTLQYRDWHGRSGVAWYTLPDVRACLACGQALRLRRPSVATWARSPSRLGSSSWHVRPVRSLDDTHADWPKRCGES
jgi:hypothetical protein